MDISDALSEKEKVKFTVHTKTTLPEFRNSEFIVVRQHEEFVWLHDRYEENEDYAGYIVSLHNLFLFLRVILKLTVARGFACIIYCRAALLLKIA